MQTGATKWLLNVEKVSWVQQLKHRKGTAKENKNGMKPSQRICSAYFNTEVAKTGWQIQDDGQNHSTFYDLWFERLNGKRWDGNEDARLLGWTTTTSPSAWAKFTASTIFHNASLGNKLWTFLHCSQGQRYLTEVKHWQTKEEERKKNNKPRWRRL